jgi:hypothetical protein
MWLMYILLAAAVIVPIIIGIYNGRDMDSFGLGCAVTFLSWVIAALLLLLTTLIFAMIAEDCCGRVETRTEQIEMYALSDSQDIYGQFGFLGSGYIDEELTYYYVVQEKDEYGRECFDVKSIDADDAGIIYIADNEKPYMLQSYYKYDNGFFGSMFGEQTGKIYFYVPKGSIIEQYKVDLE